MTDPDSNSLETGQAGLTGSCAVVLPFQQQPAYETGTGDFVAPCSGYTPSTNPAGGPGPILGCTDLSATNYNASATMEDGTCVYAPVTPILGCTDSTASNYNPLATQYDGSCVYGVTPIPGCTDPTATNYNPLATQDDGSCVYPSPCLMYPAPTYDRTGQSPGDVLTNPLYPASDLPATLNVLNANGSVYEVMTRVDGTYGYSGTITDFGNDGISAELPQGDWHAFISEDYYTTNSIFDFALPNGLTIADTFLNSYAVQGFGNPTIHRQSACTWTGGTVTVRYDAGQTFAGFYGWILSNDNGMTFTGKKNVGDNSSPVGNYYNSSGDLLATLS